MPLPFLAAAAEAGSGDFSMLETLGPYAAFGALALIVLRMLHAEMLRREKVLGERITHLEEQVESTSDKLIEIVGKVGPVLAESTRVLSEAVGALSERQES